MMLGLSGGLIQYAPDIRVMPDYCQATSLDPRSWFRGLLEACAPYAQDELDSMTRVQATGACQFAADPAACEAGLIAAAASAQSAAEATDPSGTCEYNASQEHPALSSMLGTAAVCDLYAGKYTAYIVAGAVAVGFLLLYRKGRY